MSLDFYLEVPVDVGGKEPHVVGLFSRNITHNVAPMWVKAGVYDALYNSEGKQAREIIETLSSGENNMLANSAEYIALNPSNGWGNYNGALDFLQGVLAACKEYPKATIRIWA